MTAGQTNDRMEGARPATVAVLDVGKTNVKFNAATAAGAILETLSIPNPVSQDGPWKHHDLQALSGWIFDTLGCLARRHALSTFVSSGHGSGGVLVGSDPDDDDGTALPMIDYEQALPDEIRERYTPLAGSFFDRGSAMMHGATHNDAIRIMPVAVLDSEKRSLRLSEIGIIRGIRGTLQIAPKR